MGVDGNWSEAMDRKIEQLRRDPANYYKGLRAQPPGSGPKSPAKPGKGLRSVLKVHHSSS